MLPWLICAALAAPGDDIQAQRYHLSRSLLEEGLTASAEALLLELVRDDLEGPLVPYALAKLAGVAELTGDSVELRRIVGALDPGDFPPTARSILHYHRARDLYERGELTLAREALSEVTPGSPEHPRALLLDGIVAAEQHKLRSAVRAFRDAYRDEDADEELRALAVLNIARVYYSIARYTNAEVYYDMVSRDSSAWPAALTERAWTRFMINEPAAARGDLITLSSPQLATDYFTPERALLGAVMEYSRCAYESTVAAAEAAVAAQAPMQAELGVMLSGASDPAAVWLRYFGDGAEIETALPDAFFAGALRDQALAGTARHLAAIEAERPLLSESTQALVGPALDARQQALERQAGELLLGQAARTHRALAELREQADVLKLEALTTLYLRYDDRAAERPLKPVIEELDVISFDRPRAHTREVFSGEFWEDELGYYSEARPSECP